MNTEINLNETCRLSIALDLRLHKGTPTRESVGYRIALSLVDVETPDPFLVHAPTGSFYLLFTCGDRIDALAAPSLAAFRANYMRFTLWHPPQGLPHSADIWAPEMHVVNGRWYIYFAAAHPLKRNASHRIYVLGGPPADSDPMSFQWHFLGPLQGMPTDQWAIDGTLFSINGRVYFAYSGWPVGELKDDLVQEIFIARLISPTRVNTAPARISKPDHPWEFTRDSRGLHGINEGPQILKSPDGAWTGLVYSCAGSWTSEYKMSTLKYTGGDPMCPKAWRKAAEPLLQAAPVQRGGLWAPGHGNFLNIGKSTLAVFHATESPHDGWSNRKARIQCLEWTPDPRMGRYVGRPVSDFDEFNKFRPSAEPLLAAKSNSQSTEPLTTSHDSL